MRAAVVLILLTAACYTDNRQMPPVLPLVAPSPIGRWLDCDACDVSALDGRTFYEFTQSGTGTRSDAGALEEFDLTVERTMICIGDDCRAFVVRGDFLELGGAMYVSEYAWEQARR